MKKMMIGILILIPIIILLVVAAVSNIVSMATFITVDEFNMSLKSGTELQLELNGDIVNMSNFVNTEILPERATNKTITWSIEELQCRDEDYEARYEAYRKYKEDHPNGTAVAEVKPAAMMVDGNGNEVTSNTSGRFIANAYSVFYLKAQVGTHSQRAFVLVTGYDVESVVLRGTTTEMTVGDAMLLSPVYTPVDSIVNQVQWVSSNPDIASVDANGTITAKKPGTANITLNASVYSSEKDGLARDIEYVQSAPYTVTVSSGVSTVYGNSVTTDKTSLTLEELGLSGYDPGALTCSGCSINSQIVTITDSNATITTSAGVFTINRCSDAEIRIINSDIYNYDESSASSFVLEVSNRRFVLSAAWLSQTKDEALTTVEWSSSDNTVATVDQDGVVSAIASGIVTITASSNGQTATVTLNVQTKIASISLKTTNESLTIGIAQETVFAAEKYIDVSVNNHKVANSVLIELQSPQSPTPDKESPAYHVYLNSFNFEIVEGSEYATFEEDEINRLIFKPTALEGKGKTIIKVKVSAKYPKYESISKYTTAYVDIRVIYGVEVTNIAELRRASADQETYAKAEGNVIYKHEYTTTHASESAYPNATGYTASSEKTYAICFADVIAYEANESIDWGESVKVFGDVYGNNKMLKADKGQLVDTNGLIYIVWSDVTMSNLTLRTTAVGDEISNDPDSVNGLTGYAIRIYHDDSNKIRLNNIAIEYCIMENAQTGLSIQNIDITIDGCIFRNIARTAMYVPTRINTLDGREFALFSNLTLNNLVVSNVLGTAMSAAYEHYSIDGESERDGWRELYEAGLNTTVRQKGFLDIYNWQPLDAVQLLKDTIGNVQLGAILDSMLGDFIAGKPYFDPYRWRDTENNKDYFHLGMISTEISGSSTSKTYIDITFEDSRFNDIYTKDPGFPDEGFIGDILTTNFDLHFYAYAKNVDISPTTVFDEAAAIAKIIANK